MREIETLLKLFTEKRRITRDELMRKIDKRRGKIGSHVFI
jgi:hypothetical protein